MKVAPGMAVRSLGADGGVAKKENYVASMQRKVQFFFITDCTVQ